ncbi:MAG: hypothetical protein VSS75_033160 [Candidatus Parabeggiatoa sp.]|nr:hypothetical protein [Candidatus Parabeggiatoa sp.]
MSFGITDFKQSADGIELINPARMAREGKAVVSVFNQAIKMAFNMTGLIAPLLIFLEETLLASSSPTKRGEMMIAASSSSSEAIAVQTNKPSS